MVTGDGRLRKRGGKGPHSPDVFWRRGRRRRDTAGAAMIDHISIAVRDIGKALVVVFMTREHQFCICLVKDLPQGLQRRITAMRCP